MVGVWIALTRHSDAKRGMFPALLCAIGLCLAVCAQQKNFESAGFLMLVIALFYLADDGTLPSFGKIQDKLLDIIRQFLSSPPCCFLGKISYSFYLVHLLVLIPCSGYLTGFSIYMEMPAIIRFMICAILAGAISLVLAHVLFRLIEQPGINAGKNMLATLQAPRNLQN